MTLGIIAGARRRSSTSLVATDTFTRANSSTIGTTETGGKTWTTTAGTWSIASNQLLVANAASTDTDCYIEGGIANGTVSYTIGTVGNLVGAVVRALGTGNTNGYIVWRNSGTLTLSKRTNPQAYTSLGTGGALAAGDAIDVVMNGSSIIVRKNGTQVISATDSTYMGTRHGFFSTFNGGGSFDNFQLSTATI